MPYSKKIVLHCPDGATLKLEQLVEDFIQGGVTFIAIVGKDCAWVEDLIDGFVVGDGTKDRFILTSSHSDEIEWSAWCARYMARASIRGP